MGPGQPETEEGEDKQGAEHLVLAGQRGAARQVDAEARVRQVL